MANVTGYKTPWLKASGFVSVKNSLGEWVSLPDPKALKHDTYDLDSGDGSGRNQSGEMLRDRVAVKEKLEMTFPAMYRVDYQKMLLLTKEQFFTVRYYSDYYQGWHEAIMYVGDRSNQSYFMQKIDDMDNSLTQEISFNFIEK